MAIGPTKTSISLNQTTYTEVAAAGEFMLTVDSGGLVRYAVSATQPADDFVGHTLFDRDTLVMASTDKVWAKAVSNPVAIVVVSQ